MKIVHRVDLKDYMISHSFMNHTYWVHWFSVTNNTIEPVLFLWKNIICILFNIIILNMSSQLQFKGTSCELTPNSLSQLPTDSKGFISFISFFHGTVNRSSTGPLVKTNDHFHTRAHTHNYSWFSVNDLALTIHLILFHPLSPNTTPHTTEKHTKSILKNKQ